jgi:hypothetical protein
VIAKQQHGGNTSSWGLELSKTTLALNNIATYNAADSQRPDTTSIIIPPITSSESVRKLLTEYPQLYQIREVNHQPVSTVDDIIALAAASNNGEGAEAATVPTSLLLLLRKVADSVQVSAIGTSTTLKSTPSRAPEVSVATTTKATQPTPERAVATGECIVHPNISAQSALEDRVKEAWTHAAAPSINSPIVYPFTVAIHRPRGVDRWGIRVGEESLWLKRVPPSTAVMEDGRDRAAATTSNVLASHPALARSLSDTLQEQPHHATAADHPSKNNGSQHQPTLWAPSMCFITGVNQRRVTSQGGLMEQLQCVGLEGNVGIARHADSVSLQCARVALPRVSIHDVPIPQGEGERWGLRLRDTDATLLRADANAPFGQRILEVAQRSARELSAIVKAPLSASVIFPSLTALIATDERVAASVEAQPAAARQRLVASVKEVSSVSRQLLVDDDDVASGVLHPIAAEQEDGKTSPAAQLFEHWADVQCSSASIRWSIHSIVVSLPSNPSSDGNDGASSARPPSSQPLHAPKEYCIDGSTDEAKRVLQMLRHDNKYRGALVTFQLQQLVAMAQD